MRLGRSSATRHARLSVCRHMALGCGPFRPHPARLVITSGAAVPCSSTRPDTPPSNMAPTFLRARGHEEQRRRPAQLSGRRPHQARSAWLDKTCASNSSSTRKEAAPCATSNFIDSDRHASVRTRAGSQVERRESSSRNCKCIIAESWWNQPRVALSPIDSAYGRNNRIGYGASPAFGPSSAAPVRLVPSFFLRSAH